MKLRYLTLSFVFLIFLISACATQQTADVAPTTKETKTKAEDKPISEYDKCLMEVEKGIESYENYFDSCVKTKLLGVGYDDDIDIDCIEEEDFSTSPFCTPEIFNEQVNAWAECEEEEPDEIKNRIVERDCLSLI